MNDLFIDHDKRCDGRNVSATAAPGGVAIGGIGNRVTGVVVGKTAASAAQCAKCPYKKKVAALEKLMSK